MKLQLVAVGTKMPDWVQTGFSEYLRRFPKDMPFELVEIPAGKRGKNADIKRILEKEGELDEDELNQVREHSYMTGEILSDYSELGDIIKHAQTAGSANPSGRRQIPLRIDPPEKLDTWADDLKVGLEREIKDLDRRIKEVRTLSKGAATLSEKLAAQKEQRDLEGQRDRKRRELFDRQDEIQDRRDGLIDELEKQLMQKITAVQLFTAEWEVR